MKNTIPLKATHYTALHCISNLLSHVHSFFLDQAELCLLCQNHVDLLINYLILHCLPSKKVFEDQNTFSLKELWQFAQFRCIQQGQRMETQNKVCHERKLQCIVLLWHK